MRCKSDQAEARRQPVVNHKASAARKASWAFYKSCNQRPGGEDASTKRSRGPKTWHSQRLHHGSSVFLAKWPSRCAVNGLERKHESTARERGASAASSRSRAGGFLSPRFLNPRRRKGGFWGLPRWNLLVLHAECAQNTATACPQTTSRSASIKRCGKRRS